MKRILFVLLCTLLLFGMVACAPSAEKGYEEQKDLPNDTIAKDTVKTYEEQKTLYNDIIAKYTGCSPIEYRNDLRLAGARGKLRSGEYNVSEAAELCGFTNLSFFIRLYKKKYGHTPKKE